MVPGCAVCEGMNLLPENPTEEEIFTTVLCVECLPGMYLAGVECKSCPFGSTECALDEATLSTDV